MIGIDTNVLLRYLLDDDPRQSAIARKFIDSLDHDSPGFISLPVILEVVWVLQSFYRFPDLKIAEAVELLLSAPTFFLQNSHEIHRAVLAVQNGQGTFEDSLISQLGAWIGCTQTVTFDRKAARLPGFRLL